MGDIGDRFGYYLGWFFFVLGFLVVRSVLEEMLVRVEVSGG